MEGISCNHLAQSMLISFLIDEIVKSKLCAMFVGKSSLGQCDNQELHRH